MEKRGAQLLKQPKARGKLAYFSLVKLGKSETHRMVQLTAIMYEHTDLFSLSDNK